MKYRREHARDFVDYIMHANHRLAVSKQAFYAGAGEQALSRSQLAGHFRTATGAVYGKLQLLHIERLLEKIKRAVLKNLKRSFRVFGPSKTNDWKRDRKISGRAEELPIRL